MRARRLSGASAIRARNRASWKAVDQYCLNRFLSIVVGSCLSAVQRSWTESSGDGQDSKTSWRIIIIIIMVIFKCYFSGELIALSYKKL